MLTIFYLIFKVLCNKIKRPDVWGKEDSYKDNKTKKNEKKID